MRRLFLVISFTIMLPSPASWAVSPPVVEPVTSVGSSPAGGSRGEPRPQEALADAQRDFAEGRRLFSSDPEAAKAALVRATKSAPAFAPPWYALAMLERRAGRHGEAIAAYERYLALAPTEVEPLFGLGLSQQALGRTSEARATLGRFVARATDPWLAPFVARARALLATPPAASQAGPASAGAPADGRPAATTTSEGPWTQARRERAAGRNEQALALYQRALAERPTDAALALESGEAFLSAARWVEAREVLTRATQLAPTNPDAFYALAVVKRQLRHDAEAARAYRVYVTARPTDPDAYYGLAAALAAAGDRAGAAAALRTYLRLENRPEEARWVARAQRRLDALEGRR